MRHTIDRYRRFCSLFFAICAVSYSAADPQAADVIATPSDKLKIENPLRTTVTTPTHKVLFKPSSLTRTSSQGQASASVVMKCVSQPFSGSGLPATALVVAGDTGIVEAVMNVGKLNGPRTTAGSACVAQLYGSRDAEHMVVFGSGLQAFWHIKYLLATLPTLRNVTIVSRNQERQATFIKELEADFPQASFSGADQLSEEAVKGAVSKADLIVSCGPMMDRQLFDIAWLKTEVMILDVGTHSKPSEPPYNLKALMEPGSDGTSACQNLLIDCYDACVPESKDLQFIRDDHEKYRHRCVDLGKLVHEDGTPNAEAASKVKPGRVTVYRSAGVAAMDNTICTMIYREASRQRMGTVIEDY